MIYAHMGQTAEACEQIKIPTGSREENRTPQVAQGMNQLGRQISQVAEILDRLSERLSPVLRPSDPVPQEKAGGPSQKLCHLAEYIDEHISAVLRLQATLQYLYDHLEL